MLLIIKLHVSAGSGHHHVLSIQKLYKMVLYNLCNGVLMKRSRHQYPVFIYGYCYYIGSVGNSFG